MKFGVVLGLALLGVGAAQGAEISVRLTQVRGVADFEGALAEVNAKAGLQLEARDFDLAEKRSLHRFSYEYYVQKLAGLPLRDRSLRIWRNAASPDVIVQLEANLERPETTLGLLRAQGFAALSALPMKLDSTATARVTRQWIRRHGDASQDDRRVRSLEWRDEIAGGRPVRAVRARARYGMYHLDLSLQTGKVLQGRYEAFPRDEFSVRADVYPIYEETERTHEILGRISAELKYLTNQARRPLSDPFAELRQRAYPEDKLDPVLGETEAGRAAGYWSSAWLKREGARLSQGVPLTANDPLSEAGAVLAGRYATINVHPDAASAFGAQDLGFSSQMIPVWREASDGSYAVIPSAGLLGMVFKGPEGIVSRPARRLPDHAPAAYLRDGFDEVQVYFAINTLFDSLRPMGWLDDELSTRPFHAFLYDPDISMRDNAYYTDDTINFTTYSPESINYARDNSTIWHELGHGVMDRMMGDHLKLADTGGLSEGMADFIAALVIEDVSQGRPFPGSQDFRIINGTGFGLTNEVHDDGEAYGGAMHDLLRGALAKLGREGLTKVTDLTLEAMRLARNHPHLTAEDWFERLFFADALGAAGVREPGELSGLLTQALAGRNFSMEPGSRAADFVILREGTRLEAKGPGSRGEPVKAALEAGATASYRLDVSVASGTAFAPQYPLRVRVAFNEGALQGAVHWKAQGRDEAEGAQDLVLASEAEHLEIPVEATAKCDQVNRDDGSCVDYVYLKLFDSAHGDQPIAKKRFYVRVIPQ